MNVDWLHIGELLTSGLITAGVAWGAMKSDVTALRRELSDHRRESATNFQLIYDKLIPGRNEK